MGVVHITSSKKGGTSTMSKIIQFLRDEEGSNASEYALILALVAVVIITAVTTLGSNIAAKVTTAATSIGP